MSMSLLPRSFIHHSSPTTSFHPLFQLLDDFSNYRNENPSSPYQSQLAEMKTFSPRFDVRELKDVYELHGELPGVAQKDVEIEFSDENTITIKGRIERSYTSPEDGEGNEAITVDENGDSTMGDSEGAGSTLRKARQPTVEDEDAAAAASKEQDSTGNGDTQIAKVAEKGIEKRDDQKSKYWVSERSVGEFARSFTFPVRVDQESVKAKMANGVLSVVVPKAKRVESRRIVIE